MQNYGLSDSYLLLCQSHLQAKFFGLCTLKNNIGENINLLNQVSASLVINDARQSFTFAVAVLFIRQLQHEAFLFFYTFF